VRESGIQGRRGQVTSEHFDRREEAEQRLAHFRDMQIKRGYTIMFREGAQLDGD
jgi:predicted DNA-binding WGR domain protein